MENRNSTHDRMDLRSDKVRRLLGEEPSPIVRYGTFFIIGIFIAVIVILTFIPYSADDSGSLLEYIVRSVVKL